MAFPEQGACAKHLWAWQMQEPRPQEAACVIHEALTSSGSTTSPLGAPHLSVLGSPLAPQQGQTRPSHGKGQPLSGWVSPRCLFGIEPASWPLKTEDFSLKNIIIYTPHLIQTFTSQVLHFKR